MSYEGGYGAGKTDLPSQKSWRVRDVVFLLGSLAAAATLATVVIGTVVVLGGGALLLFSPILIPLLLLFSPVLIPLVIATVVIGGGTLFAGGTAAAGIATATWLYRYFTGRHPYGAESVDELTGRVKGVQQQLTGYVGKTAERYIGQPAQQVMHGGRQTADVAQQRVPQTSS